MGKNGFLEKIQQQINDRQRIAQAFEYQVMMDAALLVLHEEFGFGADRGKKFAIKLAQKRAEIARMAIKDNKDDSHLSYTKGKIDKQLRQFIPDLPDWESRYKIDLRKQ